MSEKGLKLKHFEQQIAQFIGTKYAVVTGSGRAALKIALRSLEVDGGNVIVSNLTCAIVPQIVISAGFRPLFVDINKDLSLNLKPLESNYDKKNRVIIVNYLYGCPTDDIVGILDFAKDRHLFVIEDATQSFGAKINGRQVGSLGDIGIFSFPKCFFNLFRGGAITTNDKRLADNAYKYRAQMQDSPNIPSLQFRYFRRSMPDFVKRLYGALRQKTRQEALSPCSYPTGLYKYQETTYPYQFQGLADLEIKRGLHTLHSLEKLRAGRMATARDILGVISDKADLGLRPLFPYQPDFTYTKNPVIIESSTLSEWMTCFGSRGIIIDMDYQQAPYNILWCVRSDGQLRGAFHCDCGDRFKWVPPHKDAIGLGIARDN